MQIREVRGFFSRIDRRVIIILIALIIVGLLITYFYFFYNPRCLSYDCFQRHMKSCSKVNFINEQQEASWGYDVVGRAGFDCNVKVTLLQAKKGELGIDKLNGYSMNCYYPPGTAAYPERDLSMCHGRLKEELQGIIITKLHTYIIDNLGKLDDELSKVV